VEGVEAATQRFAIQGDGSLGISAPHSLELGGMAAEGIFNCFGVQLLENVADGGMRGSTAPCQAEGRVEAVPVDVDEGDDAAI